jgi:hypothetical protein
LPSGTGSGNDVAVSVNDRWDINFVSFNYFPPTVSSLSPSSGPTIGGVVTISGTNFGVGNDVPRYILANDEDGNITAASDSSITVVLPPVSGAVEVCVL